jgi:penicillin-binding protein 2
MTMLSVRREVGEFKKRYKWMALVVLATFGLILFRLVYLQLITYDKWAAEARNNITKHVMLPATRGIIRDDKGREIANNRPSYNVYLTPQFLRPDDVKRIARLMRLDGRATSDLQARIDGIPERRRSHMIEVFSDITRDQLAALATHKREFAGLDVVAAPLRNYPYGSLGAHTIGFLNEVDADDLKRLAGQNYRAGQKIGRSGVEQAWESYLRGRDGELVTVVDVRGREVGPLGPHPQREPVRTEPVPGRDLRLSLDMDLMRIAERAFRGHPSGGAVLVEVRTGRVRALYSKPNYDLNEMSTGPSSDKLQAIEKNPFRPLIDKTVYESYFPGSVFKPIVALAALQDGIIDPAARIECPGYYELGGRRYRCGDAHGEVDMRKALVVSCNVYFYHLAELVGLDRMARLAREFGLGAKTGLGINTEAPGFIPTRKWYEKRLGKYRVGFTLNEALGQGNTRVTMIQLALAYAAIANGGTLYVPQLVESVEAPGDGVIEQFAPRVRRRVNVDREHLTFMVDALFGVVNDAGGTAFEARLEGGVLIAGKTGTAQVAQRRPLPGENRRAWYYRRSHAWFVGFAPAPDPELAVAVLVEHGGPGGKYAAPIAIQILQEALAREVEK